MSSLLEKITSTFVNQTQETWKVKYLIEERQNNKIIIPDYQRNFVWEPDKQCRFIESIFMNVPIPPIFLLEKDGSQGIYEIIDGVQRLTTLENFCEPSLSGENTQDYQGLRLKNLDTLCELNNHRFLDLPEDVKNKFLKQSLNVIIIKSDTHPEIQFQVFGRLNQGSVTLKSQELRNCIYRGEFNNFLKIECRGLPEYAKLLESFPMFSKPKPGQADKARMLDIELILRFFCLHELFDSEKNQYPSPTSETFNSYMRENSGSINQEHKQYLLNLLAHSSTLVHTVFTDCQLSKNFFKKISIAATTRDVKFTKTLNQAIFDVQMLGFIGHDFQNINQNSDLIYDAFLDVCCYDKGFVDSITKSTNSSINTRMTIWKNKIDDVLSNHQKYRKNFNKKREIFDSKKVTCSVSGLAINLWHELDIYRGKIYHRAYSPKLDLSPPVPKGGKVQFRLQGGDYEYDNVKETVLFILALLKDTMNIDDKHDINRLCSLDFIATHPELSHRYNEITQHSTSKIMRDFIPINVNNNEGKSLFFDNTGKRKDVLNRLEEIASLFSSMKDFEILN